MRDKLAAQQAIVVGNSPEAFKAEIARELARMKRAVAAAQDRAELGAASVAGLALALGAADRGAVPAPSWPWRWPSGPVSNTPKSPDFAPAPAGLMPTDAKPEAEQFAHRRGPARHPLLEAEIVQSRQFFRREHDLQALAACQITV